MAERSTHPSGDDNPWSDPSRLFGVVGPDDGKSEWGDAVRRSLTDAVATVRPSGADLAGRAIAAGRRVRRRRNATGLAAVLAAMVVFIGGWLSAGSMTAPPSQFGPVGAPLSGVVDGDQPAEVTPRSSPPGRPARLADAGLAAAEIAADLLGDGVDGSLVLAPHDGDAQALGPIQQPVSAHRVGDGWAVVSGEPGGLRLWWVAPGGDPAPLLVEMEAIVVEDGRAAWQKGVVLAVGSFSAEGSLVGIVTSTAPEDGQPVGFLGGAVLMARTDPEGRSWDTWHPSDHSYQPAWTRAVTRVYGALGDGAGGVGLVPPPVGVEGACLARLGERAPLDVGQTVCVGEQLAADGPAALSPAGRWLVATTPERGLMLVDLVAVFEDSGRDAVTAMTGVAAPVTAPVWVAPDRLLVPTGEGLVEVRADGLRARATDAIGKIPSTGPLPLVVEP